MSTALSGTALTLAALGVLTAAAAGTARRTTARGRLTAVAVALLAWSLIFLVGARAAAALTA